MRESELLARIAAGSANLGDQVRVGPGDDCAVIAQPQGLLLLTVDHLIQDRHFIGPMLSTSPGGAARAPSSAGTDVALVARKAVARSVSDIAAMAGVPRWSLGAAALPADLPQSLAEELCDAIARHASALGCPMVGGDLASTVGPPTLSVTVGGEPATPRGPVLRSGARAGDALWVTGRLGGSFASGRHLTFEPRVREAAWLARTLHDRLHAMIDISDGLGIDSGRIAAASAVRVRLHSAALPLHNDVIDWRAAVADGEDYELLFALDPAATLPERCPETGVRFTRVGEVLEGRGAVVVDDKGAEIDASQMGWDHGAASVNRSRDQARPRAPR